MENQPEQDFEDGSEELNESLAWTDMENDMSWVMLRGTFDDDEFQKAREDGRAKEFVKSNYTFSVPHSQMSNKKKSVYRDAHKSAKAEN
ncbi:hypothetical protein BGZ73_002449 [Actinomortierella ambigua]|nr:hypothetical protein BGZ73_002449 [Actinomortierella ambigua]